MPVRVYEVAISYHGRTYAEGKKIGWRDGCAALVHIMRYNLLRTPEQCWKRSWAEVPGLVAGTMAGDTSGDPARVRGTEVGHVVK